MAAPSQSLAAAKKIAQDSGYDVRILGDALEGGEARELAQTHAELALFITQASNEIKRRADFVVVLVANAL